MGDSLHEKTSKRDGAKNQPRPWGALLVRASGVGVELKELKDSVRFYCEVWGEAIEAAGNSQVSNPVRQ
jgi:hypothetical protein